METSVTFRANFDLENLFIVQYINQIINDSVLNVNVQNMIKQGDRTWCCRTVFGIKHKTKYNKINHLNFQI